MRVSLRHAERTVRDVEEQAYKAGDLMVDLAHRRHVAGRTCTSRPMSTGCSPTLIKHAGKVLTHKQLLKGGVGRPYDDQPHYLHVFMNQLRRKIESDPRGRTIS